MTIDLALRRAELLRLRERILRAAADLAADDEGVGELNSAAGDQHLADHASDLVDLEVDQSLAENAEQRHRRDRRRARADRRWDLRDAAPSVARRSRRSGSRPSRTPPSASTTSDGRSGLSEPAAHGAARAGSTSASARRRTRCSRSRAPSARSAPALSQWIALGVIAGTAIVADQLTKSIVSLRLPLGEAVATLGPFSIHHVQNTGIAFGLFADSTTVVIVLTATAVGRDARVLRTDGPAPPRCSRSRSGS